MPPLVVRMRDFPLDTPLTPVMSLVTPHPEAGGTPATPPVEGEAPEPGTVEPTSAETEPLPSRIGRFKVLKRLGSGGMGVVYVAYDDALGRKVALKVLRTSAISAAKRAKARDRLKREAQAMAKLSHPHVITIYDVGQIDDQIFLAMEFVKGVTLTKWLRSAEGPNGPRRRTWQEVLVVFIQAGRGLSAAHRNGIIHRDFKPDNVLIDAEGRVRVGDFGLARSDGAPLPRPDTFTEVIKSVSSEKSMLDMRITRTGGMTGTPAYMAPEQYLGQAVDARTDQFSFCVALYEGLYGQRPFVGDRVSIVRESVVSGRIQEVPKDIEVPPWLRKVILRGLSVRPHDRYRSMDELLDHLTEAPRPTLSRRKWVALVASVAVLAAAAIGVYDVVSTRAALPGAAPVCEPPELGWDARRDAVARALGERPGGEQAGPAAVAAFDARATELQDMFAATCRKGEVDLALGTDALVRRRACLERRRSAFHGLVRAVSETSGPALDRAITALDELPAPRDCDDPRLLPAVAPPPADPAAAAELQRLRSGLDHAAAVLALGDAPRAWEVAQAVLPAAEQSDDLPTRAEAQYVRAAIERALGRVESAQRALEAALWAAEASRQDEVAVDALSLLLAVESEDLAHRGEARRLWPRLSAALRRLGDDGRREAAAFARHGRALLREGDGAAAYEQLSAALVRGEHALGADHLRLVPVLLDLAIACQRTGRSRDAARQAERADELVRRALPPEHPWRARVLTVAADLARDRDDPAARGLYDEALAIYAKTYGQDHPDMSAALLGRGMAHAGAHAWPSAAADLRRALAAWEHVYGPEYPRLVEPLTGLCAVESALGEHDAAQAACGRAVGLATRAGSLELASVARFAQARALAAESADPSPEARAKVIAVARQALEEAQLGGDAALASAIAAWIASRP
jgi:tetratricopeptide (TPR) repeat protein/predicted Ser/Thr protein kinase